MRAGKNPSGNNARMGADARIAQRLARIAQRRLTGPTRNRLARITTGRFTRIAIR